MRLPPRTPFVCDSNDGLRQNQRLRQRIQLRWCQCRHHDQTISGLQLRRPPSPVVPQPRFDHRLEVVALSVHGSRQPRLTRE